MPGGIAFLINGSRLESIQSRALGRLGFVVTRRHLFFTTDSIRRNHGLQRRCSYNEVGSFSEVWFVSIMANQAPYSKLTGMVATWLMKKLLSLRTCSYMVGPSK